MLLPVHRFIARRSAAVLVTEHELSAEVTRWGGTPLVIHEAPRQKMQGGTGTPAITAPPGVLRVLVVAVFARDEPVSEVLEAASRCPGAHFFITGDPTRAPDGLIESAPQNVTFTGYLGQADYARALEDTDVVLALTTESTSVMRAAYEAVYAEKPLLISDWPIAREVFPRALYTLNTAPAIAGAVDESQGRLPELRELASLARDEQLVRWSSQIRDLRAALHLD